MNRRDCFLTSREVAAILGFGLRTIERWTADGRLHAIVYRVGARAAYRYRPADVEAFRARYARESREGDPDD